MTSHITHNYAHTTSSPETSDKPSTRVTVIDTPGTDLLARAHTGWQRFLDTFEEPPHE
ncbi:hypothetical protein [Streptomyces sp. NPDC089915]|uniref:hypothetical protein n=1 Tax=Streptomyces sp. NPDC089915 TaxID=3155186 RepID=UPI0034457BF5